MGTNTTGQLIMAKAGPGLTKVIIARDMGPRSDYQPELNVRQLKILHTLSQYHSGPVVKSIIARDGYGCGKSETSKLYPITEDEVDAIVLELTPPDDEPAEEKEWRSSRGLTLTEEMDRDDSIY